MNNNYKMTTVLQYAQLLENDLSDKDKSVKYAVEQYLYKCRRAYNNAQILEKLLA